MTAQRLRWALLLTGVAAVVVAAFTGWQALRAKAALESVSADVTTLSTQLADGDSAAAAVTLRAVQENAERARSSTSGPGWWIGARTPGLSPNVTAVRTVADVVDQLARDVLPAVLEAGEALNPEKLAPRDGRVDLAPIRAAAPAVIAADRAMQRQTARVAPIDPAGLFSSLREPVREFQDKLESAESVADRAARAVRLLPPMLGADGPRSYLVLFQNNAEVRATGGIPGAIAVISVNNGRIRMLDQGSAADLGSYTKPALPLTREEIRLFGNHLGVYPADSTFTPHFPRTGELARAQWSRARGQRVDGVLSVDPIALSYLLRGTGPVPVAGGPALTADNAVQLLLNEVYLSEPDPEAQNDYFALAARRVFEVATSGGGDAKTVLEAMVQATTEQRLLLWSGHPEEQRLLAGTPISGELPPAGGISPFVGVFFNDSSADKMSYYLDYDVQVTPMACNSAGRQRLEVELRLASTAPSDAPSLPSSVVGPGGYGNLGDIVTTTMLYAPSGGWVDEVVIDGKPGDFAKRTHAGFPVGVLTLSLAPGQTRVATYTVFSGTGQPGDPQARVTPGAQPGVSLAVGPSACG